MDLEEIDSTSIALLVGDLRITFHAVKGQINIESSLYSPEFGKQCDSHCVCVYFADTNETEVRITW